MPRPGLEMAEALSDGAVRLDAADDVEENEFVQADGVDDERAEPEDGPEGAAEEDGAERDAMATKSVPLVAAAAAEVGVANAC